MPRYIDADALYEKLYPLDLVDKRLYSINAKAVADAIAKTPTADVVPKSEVERLNAVMKEMDEQRAYTINMLGESLEKAKSEVERLEREVKLLTQNTITAKYPNCVLCSNGAILTESLEEYDKLIGGIASEFAREIFAEIEVNITAALKSNYKAKTERLAKPNVDMADEFVSFCEGKIAALRGINDFIAELKKKYTEGNV